ncbi:MAG: hypothetical protein H7Y60_01230 [Rhodospirillaceae bacterium]|nr:hypothetical protein [Rhodospirillales bacterium]
MGGFSSSNPLMKVGAMAIDAYTGVPVATTALTMAEASAQNRASQGAVQGNYDRQAELMARQQAREVKDRQDLLKRTTATQRARLGAMGIGSESGSADALINGLQRQTATEVADIQSAYDINMSNLDWNRQRQEDQLDQSRRQQWASLAMPAFNAMLPSKKKKQPPPQQGPTPPYDPSGGGNLL